VPAEEPIEREAVEVQRVVGSQGPGKARRHVDVPAIAVAATVAAEVLHEIPVRIERPLLAVALVLERKAREVEGQGPREGAALVGERARGERGRLVVLDRDARAALHLLLRERLRSTTLIVPATAAVLNSAVAPRMISMRSIMSGEMLSIENPGGIRSPFTRICV
jgi:hypothetical protein